MTGFYTASNPRQIFNTHYLCSEQLWATAGGAEGQWVQFQPWIYDDGTSLLRSSRLHVRFRPTDDGWRIERYRTENLFVAPLPDGWWTSHLHESTLMSSLEEPGAPPLTTGPAVGRRERPPQQLRLLIQDGAEVMDRG